MDHNNLDNPTSQKDQGPNRKILVGGLYAITLIYIYHTLYPINALLIKYLFNKGYMSFWLGNLIPILIVIAFGVAYRKKMIRTSDARMIKIYIVWLSSLFIYFILFQFQFKSVLRQLLRKPFNLGGYQKSEFLFNYIEPLFYPITIAIIIYLLVLATRKNELNKI